MTNAKIAATGRRVRTGVHSCGNSYEAVHLLASICRMICEDRIPSGGRLPGRRELRRRFRVSSAGVKIGVNALAALQLVQLRVGLGAFVTAGAKESIQTGFEALTRTPAWHTERVRRPLSFLWGYSAARAAESFSDKERVPLAEELGELYRSLAEPKEYRRHKMRFQQIIAGSVRNRVLCRLLERSMSAGSIGIWALEDTQALQRSAEQYRRAFWAIRDGKPMEACQAMERCILGEAAAHHELVGRNIVPNLQMIDVKKMVPPPALKM